MSQSRGKKARKQELPDATELLALMKTGRRSATDIVGEHLERLEKLQPKLNGATQVFHEDALEQAKHPKPGPLSGLPITVKETFGIAGESITAGSLRMPPQYHSKDSEVVKHLRAAGAIIIARSNVPEFAMTGETNNLRFGRTNNPLDTSRVAGGSTGGEGALVASGSSAMGFGSDILGSIRLPAAFCGIVGFKPSSQAVDKTGTWPVVTGFTGSWLALGPISRSVRDARLGFDAIAKKPLSETKSPKGLRLLVPDAFPYKVKSSCIQDALNKSEVALLGAGLKREQQNFDDVKKLFVSIPPMILHDMYRDWMRMLTTSEGERLSVPQEVIRQLLRRPTIDSGLLTWLVMGSIWKPRSKAVGNIVDHFKSARLHYQKLLGKDGILMVPSVGMLAPKHGAMNRSSLRPGVNGTVTGMTFCNYCDLPSITIPAWSCVDKATGLPPSIMLACAPGAESRLLDTAEALEAAISRPLRGR